MSETIAVIAGKEIKEADFEAFLKGVPKEQQPYLSNPQFREQFKEQFLALHMFAQLGEDEKMNETDAFKVMMENATRDILAQLAVNSIMKNVTVTEEECRAYYDANSQHFTKGATVSAKHILTDSEEKCGDIRKEIEGGKAFEEAAQEYSTCPSGSRGGDLGEFGKGQMVPEFEKAAFEGEIGQVIGPVKTQFGYHLIKVEKKNEASVSSFEEVKDTIRRNLMQQKQSEAYKAKVAEMKEKYLNK